MTNEDLSDADLYDFLLAADGVDGVLTDWEANFVGDLIDRFDGKEPDFTDGQREKILEILEERGDNIPW